MTINHNPLINHLIHKPRKRVNGVRVRTNKAESRLKRSRGICQSKEYDDFLNSIDFIQKKLNLNDAKLSNILNISIRSLYRYKGRTGVLPSIKVLDKIKQLEKVALGYDIKIIKYKVSIRGK